MNITAINRKPIFDAVRRMMGRGFTQNEVARLDLAIEHAFERSREEADMPKRGQQPRLGSLSERFESAGRGAGAVSSGRNDPGGVSYGIYQLASRTGTVGAFLRAEGQPWQQAFGKAAPGTVRFSKVWRTAAGNDAARFEQAQHQFIERTHYWPAVAAVFSETGLDLDTRHRAVRDAAWSVAVQHGGAARILNAAVRQADENGARAELGYDRALLHAIYAHRSAYVLRVAERSGPGAQRTLRSLTRSRYPQELKAALAMLDEPLS